MRMERATRRGGPVMFRLGNLLRISSLGGVGDHNIFQSRRSRILNNFFYVPIRMMEL